MDPLSIASAVVTLWEAAVRLKSSIDKVGKIRQRTREISEDVLSHLLSIKDFRDAYAGVLQSDTLVELSTSLENLQSKLLRICERCERIAPLKTSGRLRRLSAGYSLWRQNDELEAELLRLKDSLQVWLSRIHLMSAARSEVAIAKIEHDTLVSLQDSRSQIRQFDDIFCQLVCDPSSQHLHIEVTSVTDLDEAWKGYIRLKMTNICDVIEEKPRLVSISPGTFTSVMPKDYVLLPALTREEGPKIQLSVLVRRLSQAWQLLFTQSSSDLPMLSAVDIFSDLGLFGVENLVGRYFQSFERDLCHTLQSHLSGLRRKELLEWLRYSLDELLALNLASFSDPQRLPILEENLEVCRQLRPLSRTRDEVLRFRLYLSRALRGCSLATRLNGDTVAALTYIQECLETVMPTYHLGHPVPSMSPVDSIENTNDNPLHTSILRQHESLSLCTAAATNAAAGDYSRARRLGRDAIVLIEDLRQFANILPSEFDFLDPEYSSLQRAIPTWIAVPRNLDIPSAHVEEINAEDELNESDSNGHYIEWGIAM